MCKELIGVFGVIGSGKSHFSSTVASARGFTHISTDLVFKEQVLTDSYYRDAASKFFLKYDVQAFVDGKYNSLDITALLFNENQALAGWPILSAFNAFNRPYVVTAVDGLLVGNGHFILEAATLPNIPELYTRCRMLIQVVCGSSMRIVDQLNRIYLRDPHRDMRLSEQVLRYQLNALRHVHVPHTTINTLDGGEFRSMSSVLAEFDQARTTSWLVAGSGPRRLAH